MPCLLLRLDMALVSDYKSRLKKPEFPFVGES